VLGGFIFAGGLVILLFFVLVAKFIGAIILGGDAKSVQALGLTILAIVGFPFAIWRTTVAQGNLDRAKDRDYADLFTKAVEQRLGAIYALERISQDSERDHVAVMETLCAYVRQNAPAKEVTSLEVNLIPSLPTSDLAFQLETWWEIFERELHGWYDDVSPPKPDIQAVLTVLGRRSEQRIEFERAALIAEKKYRLDLSDCDLRRASFANGNFEHANFSGSQCGFANFYKAKLARSTMLNTNFELALFSLSNLNKAFARSARFRYSRFVETNLDGIDATSATMDGAKFIATKIRNANLYEIQMRGADISGCHFDNSIICFGDFTDAKHVMYYQMPSAFGCAATILPPSVHRPVDWYNAPLDECSERQNAYRTWLKARSGAA